MSGRLGAKTALGAKGDGTDEAQGRLQTTKPGRAKQKIVSGCCSCFARGLLAFGRGRVSIGRGSTAIVSIYTQCHGMQLFPFHLCLQLMILVEVGMEMPALPRSRFRVERSGVVGVRGSTCTLTKIYSRTLYTQSTPDRDNTERLLPHTQTVDCRQPIIDRQPQISRGSSRLVSRVVPSKRQKHQKHQQRFVDATSETRVRRITTLRSLRKGS